MVTAITSSGFIQHRWFVDLNFIGDVTLQYSNGPETGYTALNPALVYVNNTLWIAFTTNYGVNVGKYIPGGSTFHSITQLGNSYNGPGLAGAPPNNRVDVSFLDGDLNQSCCNSLIL